MDCNKEDAIKAQRVAEGRLASGDYLGAKKFVLKAQRLNPSLCGLAQMSALVDIHINAKEEADKFPMKWRKILLVEDHADDEAVRKQYRKLLLLLHPDKNKYKGAESAFKLVQGAHQAFEAEKEEFKFAAVAGVSRRFWAACTQCLALSEHLVVYEHQYVQCPQCLRSFWAARVPNNAETPQSMTKEERVNDSQKKSQGESCEGFDIEKEKKESCNQRVETLSSSSSSSFEDFETWRSRNNYQTKRKAKISPVTSLDGSEESSKHKCKGFKGKKDSGADTPLPKKERATVLENMDEDQSCHAPLEDVQMETVRHSEREVGGIRSAYGETDATSGCNLEDVLGAPSHLGESSHKSAKENDCLQDTDGHIGECSHQGESMDLKKKEEEDTDMRLLFFEKLKSFIMNEFKGEDFQVVDVRQETLSESIVDAAEIVGPTAKSFHLKVDVNFIHCATTATHEHLGVSEDCMVGGSEVWEEKEESVECDVPDNDVFNFDDGRHEPCFEAGQIWAIYDDADGLPRFYAQISQVVSVHPFHVLMKWLYPAKPVSEEVKAWTDAGFAYTCGEFCTGKKVSRRSVRLFSHRMAHVLREIPRVICIYPQKGDVWALYEVWKPCKGKTRKCEAVVVLSEYSKELGIQVATLFPVNGYKSVYCRKGTDGFRTIPAAELSRFSHQIPAHYLAGCEVSNSLEAEEWVDLDTAAFI